MMEYSPLFIVATERSGTNLLRKRITESQDVYFGPEPAHFLKHLFYSQPYYGDLNNDENFREFIDDALALCYKHFAPWDIELESKQVLDGYKKHASTRNAVGIMDYLMLLYARSKGYNTYICKGNHLFEFIYPVKKQLPGAKFIYLYRDPRDVVLSQRKRKNQKDGISYLAKMWRDEQMKSFQLFKSRLRSDVFQVSYEDFIQDEEKILKEIHDFLELGDPGSKIEFQEFEGVQEWENLNKPTIKNNFKKYLEGLSKTQIQMIEYICRDEMEILGYEPEFPIKSFPKWRLVANELWGSLTFKVRQLWFRISGSNDYLNKNGERLQFIEKFKST